MRAATTALKVGLFVALIVGASYALFKRIHEGFRDSDGYQVHALFKDGSGLVDKSQVVIAGLPAGKIVRRSIQDNLARIDVVIDKKHTIYSNAVIYKKSLSMMGSYYLEIDPGTPYSPNPKDPKGPPIKNKKIGRGGRILNVVEATGIGDILPQIKQLVGTVNQLLEKDVRHIVKSLNKDISELIGEVKKVTTGPVTDTLNTTNRTMAEMGTQIKALLAQLNRMARDMRPLTRGAMGDVKDIVRDVKVITARLRETVEPKDPKKPGVVGRVERITARLETSVGKLTRRLEGAAGEVGGITRDVKKITGDIASGKGTLGTFITDAGLARDIKRSLRSGAGFLQSLTGIQTIVGLRSEYNVLANSLKTYVSIKLQPNPDKYYLIELIDDPRGARSVTSTVTRTDDPSKPALTRTETVSVTDGFRFSFQFAKRVGFATFRFGIKENSGGLGLDLEFFKKRLLIQTDIFNFQANVFPRLKVTAAWMFYRRLYLLAGVDDLLNSRPRTGAGGGRDYFIGAMIQFNDKDFKALMMFAGSALGGLSN